VTCSRATTASRSPTGACCEQSLASTTLSLSHQRDTRFSRPARIRAGFADARIGDVSGRHVMTSAAYAKPALLTSTVGGPSSAATRATAVGRAQVDHANRPAIARQLHSSEASRCARDDGAALLGDCVCHALSSIPPRAPGVAVGWLQVKGSLGTMKTDGLQGLPVTPFSRRATL
jgi:hypothetical protein